MDTPDKNIDMKHFPQSRIEHENVYSRFFSGIDMVLREINNLFILWTTSGIEFIFMFFSAVNFQSIQTLAEIYLFIFLQISEHLMKLYFNTPCRWLWSCARHSVNEARRWGDIHPPNGRCNRVDVHMCRTRVCFSNEIVVQLTGSGREVVALCQTVHLHNVERCTYHNHTAPYDSRVDPR